MSGVMAWLALIWLLLEFMLFGRVHPWSLVLLCALGVAAIAWGEPVVNSWPRLKGGWRLTTGW